MIHVQGQSGTEHEAALTIPARPHVPTVDLDPLADPEETVTHTVGGARPTTVVTNLQADLLRAVVHVYVGPVGSAPPAHPDVIVAGTVDDPTKWGALRGALALVSPSPYESFGLVVLEAWAAGTPVVVNAACAATREHCERSGGGLWVRDYEELEIALRRLAGSGELRTHLARSGEHYPRSRFAWPSLTDRYSTFLQQLIR